MATTAGAVTLASVSARTAVVVSAVATGGATTPYTYQWYRSTATGFSPGGGNIISGATSLTYTDPGLTPGTVYYYKMVSTDSSATPVSATSTQLVVTSTAESPEPSQFAQSEFLGTTDLRFNFNTISVMFDPAGTGTLVGGCAVKFSTVASKVPLIVPAVAQADVVIGFVNYNIKNSVFLPGDSLEISMGGNVIFLYAALAVNRGQQVVSLPAAVAGGCNGGVVPVTGSSGFPICGLALDTAAIGQLFRVEVSANPNLLDS